MLDDPIVRMNCDKCGAVEELSLCSIAGRGWDMRAIDGEIKHLGWTGTQDTETICPECQEDADADA